MGGQRGARVVNVLIVMRGHSHSFVTPAGPHDDSMHNLPALIAGLGPATMSGA